MSDIALLTAPLERIRHAILDGEWSPGEKLSPALLAARFDTSTTVIREALTRLVGENLLQAHPNRGFFVRVFDPQEFRDVTELRCVSESLALRLALERGDVGWEAALTAAHHRLLRTPRRRPDGRLSAEFRLAHWAFHRALISACGCEPMLRMVGMLEQSTDLYRAWVAPAPEAVKRDVATEHKALLDACLARDADRATALLRSHFEETARVVLASKRLQASR